MDQHQNSSNVQVGDYEYNTRDLIGHGAFAVVFKGRHRKVFTHFPTYLSSSYKRKNKHYFNVYLLASELLLTRSK